MAVSRQTGMHHVVRVLTCSNLFYLKLHCYKKVFSAVLELKWSRVRELYTILQEIIFLFNHDKKVQIYYVMLRHIDSVLGSRILDYDSSNYTDHHPLTIQH